MSTVYPAAQWQRTSPEAQGVPSGAIEEMLRQIHKPGADLHSVLIVRHGRLIGEYYAPGYDRTVAHQLYSVSKTFASMAVGVAAGKGLLKLDDKVISFFPEYDFGDKEDWMHQMTVKHLLIMSTGHDKDPYEEMVAADAVDGMKVFFRTPMARKPGSCFKYETADAYVLGAILKKLTGKTLEELTTEWFLRPIGCGKYTCRTSGEGCSSGGSDTQIIPEDMARFGLLMLNGGKWENEQLLPEWYVKEASSWQNYSVHPGNPEYKLEARQGYGYQVWHCSFGAWRADGMCGQLIMMCPKEDMVITTNCAMDNAEANLLVDRIREDLIPYVQDEPLQENPAAVKSLAAYIASRRCTDTPAGAAVPVGKWAFDPKACPLGLKGLEITPDTVSFDWSLTGGTYKWVWNDLTVSDKTILTAGGWKQVPVAVSMEWHKKGCAVLRYHAYTDGRTEELRLFPEGEKLRVFLKSSIVGEFEFVSL